MRDNCNKTPTKKNHKKIFLWCSEKKMCIINISYKRHFFPNITLIFREEKPTLQNFHNRHYSNLSLVLGKWNQFCKSTKSLPLSPLLYYYFIPLTCKHSYLSFPILFLLLNHQKYIFGVFWTSKKKSLHKLYVLTFFYSTQSFLNYKINQRQVNELLNDEENKIISWLK